MNNSYINQSAYLRTSREYPEEIHQLSVEVNRTYVDVANAVNLRTIGLFAVNRPAITGEGWYFTSSKQQSLRQLYSFGAIAAGGTLNIPYNITNFDRLVRLFGSVNTANDERPIPYPSVTANANIETKLDTVNKNIVISVGAASPAVVSGLIVFEWLSQS